ncbi:hypothetical protein ABTD43_18925, partial [Acinetobacter baumannii]
ISRISDVWYWQVADRNIVNALSFFAFVLEGYNSLCPFLMEAKLIYRLSIYLSQYCLRVLKIK